MDTRFLKDVQANTLRIVAWGYLAASLALTVRWVDSDSGVFEWILLFMVAMIVVALLAMVVTLVVVSLVLLFGLGHWLTHWKKG